MSLNVKAKQFSEQPKNLDLYGLFLDALSRETSVEEIVKVLPINYEIVAGPALLRLAELMPNDSELFLTIAYWHYHFGLDQEARQFLEKAKQLQPQSLPVFQAEIYFAFNEGVDVALDSCNDALNHFPDDRWIQSIKQSIEKTGLLNQIEGPPKMPRWHELCHKVAGK